MLAGGAEPRHPLRGLVTRSSPHPVVEAQLRRFGAPVHLSFNVNTPADLAEAERLLSV